MTPKQNSDKHDVMIRPSKTYHRKLLAIAAKEQRYPGRQALKFVEDSIDQYLDQHPELAEACANDK
jgi:hypothetical protein